MSLITRGLLLATSLCALLFPRTALAQENTSTATIETSGSTASLNPISGSLRPAYDLWRGTGGRRIASEAGKLAAVVAAGTNDQKAMLLEARIACFPTHDSFPPTDFRRMNQVALKTLPDIKRQADNGDALAQYLLAFCMQNGVGAILDPDGAKDYYAKAANAGISAAMVALGQASEREKNYGVAREWYEKAAALGDFQAEICIGDLYQYGNSVPKDMNQAFKWMEKAANRGDAYSQFLVGYWLNNGTGGITRDPEKAMDWFRKSAENGYEDAKRMLPKPVPADLGMPAKELQIAQWLKGTTQTLEAGRGKNIYVVEFWATWCPPCRASIPHLTELAKKFKDKNVVFVGISAEDVDTVAPFVEKMGDKMDYNVAVDNDRKTDKAYMEPFQAEAIPHAFVVDKQGRIVWQGHPMMGLEDTLSQIVSGKFDLEAAKRAEVASKLAAAYRDMLRRDEDPTVVKKFGEQVLSDTASDWSLLNETAWYILTAEGVKNRNIDLALRMARKGCEITGFKKAMVLDTYARALWDSGKKKEAAEREKQAIKFADSDHDKETMTAALKQYTAKPGKDDKKPGGAEAQQRHHE